MGDGPLLPGHHADGARFRDVDEVAVVLVAEHLDPVVPGVLPLGFAALAGLHIEAILPDGLFDVRHLPVQEHALGDDAPQQETHQPDQHELNALRHGSPSLVQGPGPAGPPEAIPTTGPRQANRSARGAKEENARTPGRAFRTNPALDPGGARRYGPAAFPSLGERRRWTPGSRRRRRAAGREATNTTPVPGLGIALGAEGGMVPRRDSV